MYADFPVKLSKTNRWMRSVAARLRRKLSKKAKEAHIFKLEQERKQYDTVNSK